MRCSVFVGRGTRGAERAGRVVRGVPDTFFVGPAGAPSRPPAALHGRDHPASVKLFVPAGRRVTNAPEPGTVRRLARQAGSALAGAAGARPGQGEAALGAPARG